MSRTEHAATITLGRNTVPVLVTLLGESPTEDARGHAQYPLVATLTSETYHEGTGWPGVAGIPVRFWAHVRRNPGGTLSIEHVSAYRTDKGYMEEVTDTTRSALYKALPALVESLLADPALAAQAQIEKAASNVEQAQRAYDKAREDARLAAVALAAAEERLAAVEAVLSLT